MAALEVYPVVHIHDANQAVDQTGVALEAGADGVYLIDHRSDDTELIRASFNAAATEFPDAFIGLNFLQFGTGISAFRHLFEGERTRRYVRHPDGLWVDDAQPEHAYVNRFRDVHPKLQAISYLGGIAFKYTPGFTDDPYGASIQAYGLRGSVDVVTTSGRGTGHPPNPAKIKSMKHTIGNQPLAVASGITADNLDDYDGMFDKLLVATSIETEPQSGIFDIAELKRLLDVAKSR